MRGVLVAAVLVCGLAAAVVQQQPWLVPAARVLEIVCPAEAAGGATVPVTLVVRSSVDGSALAGQSVYVRAGGREIAGTTGADGSAA